MSLDHSDPVVMRIYNIAQSWVNQNEKPGPANIVAFATSLMVSIQRLVTGRGAYKKQVVLTVLRKVIADEVEFDSEADKKTVLTLVDTLVPPAIDVIVDIATSNAMKKQCKACVRRFPCCS